MLGVLGRVWANATNTLLFGEATGRKLTDGDTEHWGFAWFGTGTMCTGWGFSEDTWATFDSMHNEIVQFCFADGSVRSVSKQIDKDSLIWLSGISDGEVVDEPY